MTDEAVREKLRLYAEDVAPVHLPPFRGVSARRRRRRTQQMLTATSAVLVVVLVVVLAAVLGGGSSKAPPATGLSSELIGGRWSLSSITTGGTVWKARPDNGFSLTFTASGYSGNDSCNSTSGTVSYGKDTVHLGSGPMNAMGCLDGDQGRMQEAFRLLLDKDLPAVVSSGTLTITAGQDVLALTRVQPAAPVDLSKALLGTTWNLISIGASGKDVSSSSAVPADVLHQPAIAFHAKDYVADDGCNAINGPASYTAATVTLGYTVSTAMACLGSHLVSDAFAKVLPSTVSATIVGDTLTIGNATQSLVFTRAGASPSAAPASDTLQSRLTANDWRLQSVTDGSLTLDVAERGWTLSLTSTSYTAQTHCLDAVGAAAYDDGHLSMAAGGGVGRCQTSAVDSRVYKAYGTVFAGKVEVGFTGQSLVLSARGTSLTYTAGRAQTVTPSSAGSGPVTVVPGMKAALIGTEWKLQTLKTATDVWHAIEGSAATVTFAADTYQVSDGCEGEGHSITYDEAHALVAIDRTGAGMGMACSLAAEPPKGSVPPQAYFDAFYGSLHVALSAGKLTLSRTGVVLTFSKQPTGPKP